ncbi:MAG: acyl-CoA dehydrogenase family protein [Byssovorax sp.]
MISTPPSSPVHFAREIAPAIRARSIEIEQARRLPADLCATMAEGGLFRISLPKSLGGFEVDAATMLETIEEVGKADGSAAWCVMIASTSALVAAYLDEHAASAVFGDDPLIVTGGVFAPRGVATPVDGGYRVSGRWPFASGCQNCCWLMGGAQITVEGKAPEARLMLFPASKTTIHDTWYVSGLCGTGSHDIEVNDLLVPLAFSAAPGTEPSRLKSPLYAFPFFGLLALGIAAVTLGIARAAADQLAQLAADKVPFGSKRPLAARPAIQAQLAEIESHIRAARAFFYDVVGAASNAAAASGEVPLRTRAELRLAACHATQSAARAIDLAYGAAGGSSIYTVSPLQRYFRDVHVATQHAMVSPALQELAGRVLSGTATDTSML